MNKLLDRTTLLAALAMLLIVKFVLVPVFEWQSSLLRELDAKSTKLSKMSLRIDKTQNLAERKHALETEFLKNAEYFYDSANGPRLIIQTSVESTFVANNVEVERFSWVLDELGDGNIRTLRALVGFKGSSDKVVRSLLSLSNFSKLVKVVEIRQRFLDKPPTVLGNSRGQVVVEFYAVDLSAHARDDRVIAMDLDGAKSDG